MESLLFETFREEFTDSKTPVKRKKIKRPGVCKICGKSFKNYKQVYVHKLIHTGEKPYMCEICGKGFNQNSNLKRHLGWHRGEKTFHCDICNKDFANKSKPYFQQHVLSHSGERPFSCELCGRSYSLKNSLDTHMRNHAKNPAFVCNVCHAEFEFKAWLERHMRIHDPNQEVYMCDLCKKVFTTPWARNYHLAKNHDILTAYECKVCHKRFKNYMKFRMHQKQHGETTVSSTETKKRKTHSVSTKGNSDTSNVRKNQKKISDLFTNAENKAKSIASVPTSTNYVKKAVTPMLLDFLVSQGAEKYRYLCGVCQEEFSSLTEINEHLKTHTNSQNLSVIQNKDISNVTENKAKDASGILTSGTHIKKVITPEQLKILLSQGPVNHRFLCGVCQRDFGTVAEINEHLSTHTDGGNFFICGLCKGSFSSADLLKSHITNTHNI